MSRECPIGFGSTAIPVLLPTRFRGIVAHSVVISEWAVARLELRIAPTDSSIKTRRLLVTTAKTDGNLARYPSAVGVEVSRPFLPAQEN